MGGIRMRWVRRAAAALAALGTLVALAVPVPAWADDDGGGAATVSAAVAPATPGAVDPALTVRLGGASRNGPDGDLELLLPTRWQGTAGFTVPASIPAGDVQVNGHTAASVEVVPLAAPLLLGPGRGRGRGEGRPWDRALPPWAEDAFVAVVVHVGGVQGPQLALTISGTSGLVNPAAPGNYPVLAAVGPGESTWVGADIAIGEGVPAPPAPVPGTSALGLAVPPSVVVGSAVPLSAQVTPAIGGGVVVFTVDGATLGTCTTDASGYCDVIWTPETPGQHTVGAAWGGNAAWSSAHAGPIGVTAVAVTPSGSGATGTQPTPTPVSAGVPPWAGTGLTLIASPPEIGYQQFCGAASGCIMTFAGSTASLVAADVAADGQPAVGTVVDFTLGGAGGAFLSAPSCVIGVDGTCAVTLNAGGAPAGGATYTVQASVGAETSSVTVTYGGL